MRISLRLSMILVSMLLVGCTGQTPTQTVNDAEGQFHVIVPESWQSRAEPGLMVLYGADKLPTSEQDAFETLTIGIYTASGTDTTTAGDRLTSLIEQRKTARGWRKSEIGRPAKTEVGGRPATAIAVSGTDEQGRDFEGRAVLVRTSGMQALVFAVSPRDQWAQDAGPLDEVLTNWYWHSAAGGESSKTTE